MFQIIIILIIIVLILFFMIQTKLSNNNRLKIQNYFNDKTVFLTGEYGLGKGILKIFLIIIFINNKFYLFIEISIELYKLGARVILCSRDENKLNSVKNELMNVRFKPFIWNLFWFYLFFYHLKLSIKGKEPEVFPFDITSNMNAIKPKITELMNKFETIDILINNAGINYRGEVNI